MDQIEEKFTPITNDRTYPPPPEQTKTNEKQSNNHNKHLEANLTISTKMSSDQLICKTPQGSPNESVKSHKRCSKYRVVLCMGLLQAVFGFLMMIFGIFVIVHRASLSQIGGGIWGGIIAMATGLFGILAAADSFCPFKSTAQRVAHTIFLALSLISLAVSQLILVISATGLARDMNSVEFGGKESESYPDSVATDVTPNRLGIVYNICLIVFSGLECLTAAVSAYKSSRELCPCFKKTEEDYYQENLNIHRSHAIVSSWLGKNNVHTPPQIYVVTGPTSTLGRGSKISTSHLQPVYAIPTPVVQPQIIGYPLIPAPLGPVPSPIIPPHSRTKVRKLQKRYKSQSKSKSREPTPKRSRSKSKSRERSVTQEDVVKTYTGLDRTMAEEFIDICDSRNASLCSDVSCSSSNCQSPCNCSNSSNSGCQNVSETASQEYLLNKI